MNILEILATLGSLAAAINDGGAGPGAVNKINAFVESEKGQRVIGLVDQLLAQLGVKLAIAIRK
jgi:hypothetical protein